MKIKRLIKSLGNFACPGGNKDFNVRGISCNSKDIRDGFIFAAIRGSRADGNKFIGEAVRNGAKAVVISAASRKPAYENVSLIRVLDTRKALAKLAVEFYANPSSKIKVVGITGTNGKTTIAYLLEAILKEAHFSAGVLGTINYRFKDKVIPSKNTTPGPVELQSILSDMLKEGVKYAVMEVSSHALEQERVAGVRFHSAIFTNLTQDHLDYHKTMSDYFKAKSRLFSGLSSHSFALLNSDDKYSKKLKKITKAKVITYAIDSKADIAGKDIKFGARHTEFRLAGLKGEINFKSPLIGKHNLYNVLAAIAWAKNEGIKASIIKEAIEKFSLVPGRLERVNSNADFSVFVDYAHTEDALRNVIQSLRQVSKNKLIVVFGCGGERDKTKRPKMGYVVTELSDYALITNDNPRSEDPRKIIKDIRKGIRKNNYCVIPERYEAIKKSLSLAKPGDIVLVAGKGHENYQVIKDRVIPFDDRGAIKECLVSANY